MNMKSKFGLVTLIACLSLPSVASAEFIDAFGANARVSTRTNCFAGYVCTAGNVIDSANESGAGITSATAEVIGAQAYADMNTTSGLAFMAAYTSAGATEGSNASIESIRKYEYTGIDPFTLQIDATYHADMSGVDRNRMDGTVAIILIDPANPTDDFVKSLLDSGTSVGGALIQVANSDFSNLFKAFQGVTAEGDQSFTLSVSADLNPGDQYYLYNSFSLLSYDDAIADGLSSASLSANTTEYRILERTNVVPIPAAVWLFGSGLLGLVGVARRKV